MEMTTMFLLRASNEHSLALHWFALPSITQKPIGISSCFMPQSTSYIASITMKNPTRRCLRFSPVPPGFSRTCAACISLSSSATRWHALQAAAYFSDESGWHLDSYWFLVISFCF